jgi:hypothetical protein
MSDKKRFSGFPARFGDILVRDLFGARLVSASNKTVPIPCGALDPSAVINSHADPMIMAETRGFDDLFAGSNVVSLTAGYAANTSAGTPTAATLFQLQERADGATFTSGSTHAVGTNNKGFLSVAEISAAQDDTDGAKIALEYYALSADGLTVPISWNGASALTSSPLFDEQWYLGPVYVGDVSGSPTLVSNVQNVRIRPGVNYRPKRGDGNPFAIVGSIESRTPEIRISILDLDDFYTVLGGFLFGKDIVSIRVNCFFVKGIHGGSRYAYNTNNHYRVTATTGDITPDQISFQGTDDGLMELVVRPTGTLTLTANTAIPA